MSKVIEPRPVARKSAEPERVRRISGPASVTPSSPLPLETLLYLQKFAGNAAVAEMLGASTEKRNQLPREARAAPIPGEATVATALPTLGILGSLFGPAITPGQQPASGGASSAGAATAEGAAKSEETAAAGAVRPVDQKPEGAAGAADAKGGEASTGGAARPVDQRPAAAGAADGAKGGEASTAGAARPVDQRPADATGAADGAKGADRKSVV